MKRNEMEFIGIANDLIAKKTAKQSYAELLFQLFLSFWIIAMREIIERFVFIRMSKIANKSRVIFSTLRAYSNFR